MSWIVLGEKNGKINLVSKSNVTGILPKGSYLTIEQEKSKFILRVDDSHQNEPYSPSPIIVDMDLSPLYQDQKCQNIITAYRVKDISNRTDGLIDYIPPQAIARRSSQEEIDLAMGNKTKGPKVFLATVHSNQNQLLTDEMGNYITTKLPEDIFFHQILICGKTGSGKTVATKYLAQYFVEDLGGAVLAINVKDVDFLKMDKPSKTDNLQTKKEWEALQSVPHGIYNYTVYYPSNTEIGAHLGITSDVCKKITLSVEKINPESLIGLLQGISDVGAQNLPDIFRYWQEKRKKESDKEKFRFSNFVDYFLSFSDTREFNTLNERGDISTIKLHPSTFDNVVRNIDSAKIFFDNEGAEVIDQTHILQKGKMSIINVASEKGIQFGSILLRDLLKKIVKSKTNQESKVPILIIIDEVHQFYNTDSSKEALGDLDTICRTGRSQNIGVIFSSQNPSDIPKGLSSVINTKIFFKSDAGSTKIHGINVSSEEIEGLKKGYAAASIHDMSQIKITKFPLSFCGVFEEGR